MLWFALGVIAVMGITLVFLRLWMAHEPGERPQRHQPPPRPYAPDDDEEFLRSLSRRHRD